MAVAASLGLLGLAALFRPMVTVLPMWGGDPFDEFEVIGVAAEPASGRYAVTYRYHHADSSRGVFATWVLPAPAPLGSTNAPPGKAPVLVWTSRADISGHEWSGDRVVVRAAKATDRRAGQFEDCYFKYEQVHLVCFDPSAVQLIDEGP
jgi:hypothetical protein